MTAECHCGRWVPSPATTYPDPLVPHQVMVDRVSSTGFSLSADVNIAITPRCSIAVRGLFIYPTRTGYALRYPSARDRTRGLFFDAVTLPKSWRAIVIEAIVERAEREGFVRASQGAG